MKEKKAVMTIKELSREYHFPENALRELIKKRDIPVIMSGNRAYVVPSKFEEFWERGGTPYAG